MINVGKIVNLVQFYAGRAGVLPENTTIPPHIIKAVIDLKLKEFAFLTGVASSSAEINTVSGQKEYELPADHLHIRAVKLDGEKVVKVAVKAVLDEDES